MTTINKQVSASADDCHEINDTTIQLNYATEWVGYSTSKYDIGLRWQSVNIPQGATISSAKLTMLLFSDTGTLSTNIRGIDEDNTATWSSSSRPSQRTKTTATINANEANWNNWATGNWAYISITSVIQEIINRSGWSANNNLAIVIEDTAGSGSNLAKFRSYDYTGNVSGAKLEVVYTQIQSKNARSTMNVHPGVMFQTLTGGAGY